MRTTRPIGAVDSHTEGMPTRVVTGGVGAAPGRDACSSASCISMRALGRPAHRC